MIQVFQMLFWVVAGVVSLCYLALHWGVDDLTYWALIVPASAVYGYGCGWIWAGRQ